MAINVIGLIVSDDGPNSASKCTKTDFGNWILGASAKGISKQMGVCRKLTRRASSDAVMKYPNSGGDRLTTMC
jgi:hypothetical protein